MGSPLRDYLLYAEDMRYEDNPSDLGFFPADLINAERPRTKKERLADAVLELVKEDSESSDYLSRQSHIADLVWIEKELMATLAPHADNEHNNAVMRGRVQLLASAISKRISEVES